MRGADAWICDNRKIGCALHHVPSFACRKQKLFHYIHQVHGHAHNTGQGTMRNSTVLDRFKSMSLKSGELFCDITTTSLYFFQVRSMTFVWLIIVVRKGQTNCVNCSTYDWQVALKHGYKCTPTWVLESKTDENNVLSFFLLLSSTFTPSTSPPFRSVPFLSLCFHFSVHPLSSIFCFPHFFFFIISKHFYFIYLGYIHLVMTAIIASSVIN